MFVKKSLSRAARYWTVLIGLLCGGAHEAAAVTISFDSIDTSHGGIATIHDEFAALGVLFSYKPKGGQSENLTIVRESLWGNGAFSQPNAAAFGFNGGVAIATFVDPVSGLDGVTDLFLARLGDRSNEADPMHVFAYDRAGKLIGSASFTSQPNNVLGFNDYGLISIAVSGIHQLLFVDDSPSGADFDNFTFHPVTQQGAPVPEPATAALLGGALAATMRRSRQTGTPQDAGGIKRERGPSN